MEFCSEVKRAVSYFYPPSKKIIPLPIVSQPYTFPSQVPVSSIPTMNSQPENAEEAPPKQKKLTSYAEKGSPWTYEEQVRLLRGHSKTKREKGYTLSKVAEIMNDEMVEIIETISEQDKQDARKYARPTLKDQVKKLRKTPLYEKLKREFEAENWEQEEVNDEGQTGDLEQSPPESPISGDGYQPNSTQEVSGSEPSAIEDGPDFLGDTPLDPFDPSHRHFFLDDEGA